MQHQSVAIMRTMVSHALPPHPTNQIPELMGSTDFTVRMCMGCGDGGYMYRRIHNLLIHKIQKC